MREIRIAMVVRIHWDRSKFLSVSEGWGRPRDYVRYFVPYFVSRLVTYFVPGGSSYEFW